MLQGSCHWNPDIILVSKGGTTDTERECLDCLRVSVPARYGYGERVGLAGITLVHNPGYVADGM